jgi:hypothetical protein
MNTPSNEFVTVHMRGLKNALFERAALQRISVSVLVRRAVMRELGLAEAATSLDSFVELCASANPMVKLSIRFTLSDAEQLKAGARRAGLSHGAFIMGLLAQDTSSTSDTSSHSDRVAALTSSCAELSTLGRNIGQLCALLAHGEVEAAKEYRRILEVLDMDVRAHLRLAAAALAALPPIRRAGKWSDTRSTHEPGTNC